MTNFIKTLALRVALCFYLFILILSCTHDPIGIENLDTVCFDTQIMPILQTSCGMTGCHNGSQEGFSLEGYDAVMQSVVPGNPRGSTLYSIITKINGENPMPPDRPLSQEQRMLIEVWIAQGAHHTICAIDTGNGGNGGGGISDSICFTQTILPLLVSSCGTIGCHDATTHEEGYVFTDYNSIIKKGISPFNPNSSKIVQVLTAGGEDRMPPAPQSALTTTQINNLKKWIADGALNSNCPGATCDTAGNISYASQIAPLLNANCIGCHNSNTANGNVNLTTYSNVHTYATTLKNNELLLTAVVKKLPGFVAMPPSFTLDDCSIRKMELWIAQGALNN